MLNSLPCYNLIIMSKPKNNTIIIATITGVVALIVGYLLGAFIGFGGGDTASKYAGTYTNDTWNGNQRVSLVLNKDGTCKLPHQYNGDTCTYEVKDGYVYFNGEATSDTAIGETGLVYKEHNFTKLK